MDQELHYYFKVEAFNEAGASISNTLVRPRCINIVIFEPNPVEDKVRIIIEDEDEDEIAHVLILKLNDPNVSKLISGDQFLNGADVDISELPFGVYDAQIHFESGAIVNKLFIKL